MGFQFFTVRACYPVKPEAGDLIVLSAACSLFSSHCADMGSCLSSVLFDLKLDST